MSSIFDHTCGLHQWHDVNSRATDEDRRCDRKCWTLYILYRIKVFLKLLFAVSFSVLFITIQYAVFRISVRTFYVSLYIYIYILLHSWVVCNPKIKLNPRVLGFCYILYDASILNYLCIYVISRRSITPQHIKHSSKSLDVVQSLYFGSKLPSSGTYK